jgi:hypothetical protein
MGRIRRGAVLAWLAALVCTLVLMLARTARADDDSKATCSGDKRCCPEGRLEHDRVKRVVEVGAVLAGIYDVNEKSSSWTADFYLYERWQPVEGHAFVPQTEIVNEIQNLSIQNDRTEVEPDGSCARTKRVRSVLRTDFNLRTFPFDHQALVLQLSDNEYTSTELQYPTTARTSDLDDAVAHQLSGWKLEASSLDYQWSRRTFRGEQAEYDYATFSIGVRRHVSFHLSKYFLPLFVIVVVSFSIFWVDADDLSSEVQISVTCLLAAIALQFTEGSSLPDVNYLTIADRVYAISYVAIGLTILQVVYTNNLARRGEKDKARRVDRTSRVVFPVLLVVAIVAATVRAYTEG